MLSNSEFTQVLVVPILKEFYNASSLNCFEDWLKSKQPKDIVGHYKSRNDSPICRYLQEKYPDAKFNLTDYELKYEQDRWYDSLSLNNCSIIDNFLSVCFYEATEEYLTAEFCLDMLDAVL